MNHTLPWRCWCWCAACCPRSRRPRKPKRPMPQPRRPPRASLRAAVTGEQLQHLQGRALFSVVRRQPMAAATWRKRAPGSAGARPWRASNLEAVFGGVDVAGVPRARTARILEKAAQSAPRAGQWQLPGERDLLNTLTMLWDRWWKQSRMALAQAVLKRRRAALGHQAPSPSWPPARPSRRPTVSFRQPAAVRAAQGHGRPGRPLPLSGLERRANHYAAGRPENGRVEQRVHHASSAGNVMIPIGQRKPGLYLVEAIIGEHRATTLGVRVRYDGHHQGVGQPDAGVGRAPRQRRGGGRRRRGLDRRQRRAAIGHARAPTASSSLDRGSPEHTYVMGEDRSRRRVRVGEFLLRQRNL